MGNEEKMIRLDEKGKGDLGRGETPFAFSQVFLVCQQFYFKDGALYCYSAYALLISGWSEKLGFFKDSTF